MLNEAPDIGRKAAEGCLHVEKPLGIDDGRKDFLPVADNAGLLQQRGNGCLSVLGHPCRIKVSKGTAVVVPLAQHSIPAQPGLCRLQDEKLEEPPIIVDGDAPFLVVVGNVIGFGEINPGTATRTRLLCHYCVLLKKRSCCPYHTSSRAVCPLYAIGLYWYAKRTIMWRKKRSVIRPSMPPDRQCQ